MEAEIVTGCPEPEAGEEVGIALARLGMEADQHVILPGGGQVGGGIGVFEDEVEAVAAERILEGGEVGGALEFDEDGEC